MRMSVTVARCELCATFDMSNVDATVGRLTHDPNPEETDTMNAAESPRHSVRIHIDREPKESPNPTTGDALYALGTVAPHYELFREEGRDREDEPVPRGAHVIHLKQDEHFYTQREYKVIVNARPKEVARRELSFDEVVHLAFENPPNGPNIKFTITYRNGPRRNPEGTLTEGKSVFLKNGMVFNVTPTDKS
jgi:hypothetical protein